jgi:hypothetical protein
LVLSGNGLVGGIVFLSEDFLQGENLRSIIGRPILIYLRSIIGRPILIYTLYQKEPPALPTTTERGNDGEELVASSMSKAATMHACINTTYPVGLFGFI